MWNRIRLPPPYQQTKDGIVYFAQGLTYQFGSESQIILALSKSIIVTCRLCYSSDRNCDIRSQQAHRKEHEVLGLCCSWSFCFVCNSFLCRAEGVLTKAAELPV